jgi:hypothetical protein
MALPASVAWLLALRDWRYGTGATGLALRDWRYGTGATGYAR